MGVGSDCRARVSLNLLYISDDLLYLLVHVGLAVVLLLLELFDALEHLLHGVCHIELLLRKLTLESAQSVRQVLDVRPGTVSLRFLYLRYDVLVVREILIVQLTVVAQQET